MIWLDNTVSDVYPSKIFSFLYGSSTSYFAVVLLLFPVLFSLGNKMASEIRARLVIAQTELKRNDSVCSLAKHFGWCKHFIYNSEEQENRRCFMGVL